MKIFILEDDPFRIVQFEQATIGAEVTICTDVDRAQKMWTGDYDLILLDHDLGGDQMVDSSVQNTGAGFARWMPESAKHIPVLIHSYNPFGVINIRNILTDKGYEAVQDEPFGPTVLDAIRNFIETHR